MHEQLRMVSAAVTPQCKLSCAEETSHSPFAQETSFCDQASEPRYEQWVRAGIDQTLPKGSCSKQCEGHINLHYRLSSSSCTQT